MNTQGHFFWPESAQQTPMKIENTRSNQEAMNNQERMARSTGELD
jgi:hypothetical protein